METVADPDAKGLVGLLEDVPPSSELRLHFGLTTLRVRMGWGVFIHSF